MLLTMFLMVFTCIIYVSSLEDFAFGETSEDIIEKGKLQYQLLQEKGKLPHFGECWLSAVSHLQEGCKSLTEHMQSNIALKFTNCFLEMSGLETYNCDLDVKINLRKICLSNMSDKAFGVYTEFYTHSQSMCFFLRNQVWHEETEKTIDKLTTNSVQVNEKLETASILQENLMKLQKESVEIQSTLLEYGVSLTHALEESKTNIDSLMEEFKNSTIEQKRLLFDIFECLSSLQNWIVGEISWLDTLIFYLFGIIFSSVLTSTKRTADCRVIIYMLISVNAVIERIVCSVIIDYKHYRFVENLNANIYYYIWIVRKTLITACIIILLVSMYSHNDYNAINYEILLKIKEQNKEIVQNLDRLCNSNKLDNNCNSNYEYQISDNVISNGHYNNFNKVSHIDEQIRKTSPYNCSNIKSDYKSFEYSINENLNNTLSNSMKHNLSSMSETYNVHDNSCSLDKKYHRITTINRKPKTVSRENSEVRSTRYNFRSRQGTPEVSYK